MYVLDTVVVVQRSVLFDVWFCSACCAGVYFFLVNTNGIHEWKHTVYI